MASNPPRPDRWSSGSRSHDQRQRGAARVKRRSHPRRRHTRHSAQRRPPLRTSRSTSATASTGSRNRGVRRTTLRSRAAHTSGSAPRRGSALDLRRKSGSRDGRPGTTRRLNIYKTNVGLHRSRQLYVDGRRHAGENDHERGNLPSLGRARPISRPGSGHSIQPEPLATAATLRHRRRPIEFIPAELNPATGANPRDGRTRHVIEAVSRHRGR